MQSASCAFELLLVPDLNYQCLNLSGYLAVLLVLCNRIFEIILLFRVFLRYLVVLPDLWRAGECLLLWQQCCCTHVDLGDGYCEDLIFIYFLFHAVLCQRVVVCAF